MHVEVCRLHNEHEAETLPVRGTGRPLPEEKIMKQETRIKTEVTKEAYGNVLLSFLMGTASVVGIWYLSSVLIAFARYYS